MLKIQDIICKDKRILIREDLNVPIHKGKILDNERIIACCSNIKHIYKAGGKIGILSHLGRPKSYIKQYSLENIVKSLESALNIPVKFIGDIYEPHSLSRDYITLYENVRFLDGEIDNEKNLAKKLANLCDVFVMDAFATSHREHASTYGIAKYAPESCIGLLFQREILCIDHILKNRKSPIIAIIGGAKIESKLPLLHSLKSKVDFIIPGGGIANTFLAAKGISIGKSLYDADFINEAKSLLSDRILLPMDYLTSTKHKKEIKVRTLGVSNIGTQEMVLDIGPQTIEKYKKVINGAKQVIWNGPLGVFENERFQNGTYQIAKCIAKSESFSIAGGGDTISALNKFNLKDNISYISTGGGAFLYYLEKQNLPILKLLK